MISLDALAVQRFWLPILQTVLTGFLAAVNGRELLAAAQGSMPNPVHTLTMAFLVVFLTIVAVSGWRKSLR